MSIFDTDKDVPDAPTWRCPHCRTLQPETSRCRACLRATVTCATCRHFRPTLVSGLGLCANDSSRPPLSSDEVHPCWVSAPAVPRSGSGLLDDPGATLVTLTPASPVERLDDRLAQSDPELTYRPPVAGHGTGASPPNGGLLDAPHIPGARPFITELRRRSVRGRG